MKTAYSYVRFSTPEQEMGDSERRQLAPAEAWCARNGYTLSKETFTDRGVSAYHGKHLNGALGLLLKRVKPGEVILIEDTDRWSREDPLDALTRLRAAVEREIEVVFFRTGTRVTKKNFGDMAVIVPNFFGSLLANQESRKKGERIAAVWQAKKAAAASGKPVRMNRLPCWLEWDEESDRPIVNESRAKVIRGIFQLACEGNGVLAICRKLANTPPISTSRKPCWNPASLRRFLADRAVTGHYSQADPPVAGVWPVIVSEEVYCVAQSKLAVAKRQTRPAKSEVNLFTGIAHCAKCGHTLMSHVSNPKSKPRLVCGGANRAQSDCDFSGAPLALIEQSFLSFLADGDLVRGLLEAKAAKPSRLDELHAQLADAEKQAAKLAKLMFGDDDPPKMMYERLKQEEARAKALRAEIEAERAANIVPALENYEQFRATLPSRLNDPVARAELRRAINAIVERITLDPRGEPTANGKRWNYTVQLRGGSEPVDVLVARDGCCFQTLRPAQYARAGENVI